MANAIFQALNANNPYEQLINAIISVESQPKTDLQIQRGEVARLQGVMDDFDSTLSSLHTLLDTLTDPLSDKFEARTATAPEDGSYNVAASAGADTGSHTIQVERLARTDTRISKQFDATGGSLRAFFDGNGAQTFSIEVASPTDDDPDNRVSIPVTVTPTGATDAEIMDEIATAIDDAMDQAATDGTIKSDERAAASVVNETSTTTRFSLRSGQTGFANRLGFTDSGAGLLALLEVNADAEAAGTAGGQVTAVGTSETDSALNSKFVMDGLTLYRSTNQVNDALSGISLTLSKADNIPYDFTVEPDASAITTDIESFVEKYNSVLSYIQQKGSVDADTDTRGDFAGDQTFTGLRFALRDEAARAVAGQPADGPAYLSDLGIEIEKDGTLTLADASALSDAVERDPAAVQQFFSGTDGLATRLNARIEQYVGVNGILDERSASLESRLKRIDDQIATWDDRLAQRENQLREEYARMQETISLLQGQQQTFLSYLGGV